MRIVLMGNPHFNFRPNVANIRKDKTLKKRY